MCVLEGHGGAGMTGRNLWMRECVEGGNVDEEEWGGKERCGSERRV